MKKKKKQFFKFRDKTLLNLNINLFSKHFSDHSKNFSYLDNDSWFRSKKFNNNNSCNKLMFFNDQLEAVEYKSKKIVLLPTKIQKNILLNWMKACITMYNSTIAFFKKCRFNNQSLSNYISFYKVRDLLKKEKEHIIELYPNLNVHVLDLAIKEACKNLKANLTKGTKFRLRYIKQSKPTRIIHLEKDMFKSGTSFCTSTFGKVFKNTSNYNYKNVKCDSTIQYNSVTDRFTLYVPIEIKQSHNKNCKNSISLDPGTRKFLTGYSNEGCFEFGINLKSKLSKILKKIDLMQSLEKKKAEMKWREKITNLIDDMHWKIIKYLTDNYFEIMIGNLSTKEISKNENLNDMTKRLAYSMRLYVFKQRLKYKCYVLGKNYKEVSEAYTSKLCSRCGEYNDIKGSENYMCNFCDYKIDRDMNGAKNIMMMNIKYAIK